MKGARGLLISITGGNDLTLYEVDEAASRIRQEVDEEANIILGATFEFRRSTASSASRSSPPASTRRSCHESEPAPARRAQRAAVQRPPSGGRRSGRAGT